MAFAERGISLKRQKTNVMRILERESIPFLPLYYDLGEREFSGEAVAEIMGLPPEQGFKTLLAKGAKRGYLVFVIPANEELDLKKAAAAAGDKNVEMLHQKDLLLVSGYQRGEVSPLGMKKAFPTFIDETAILFGQIAVSAGKKGSSVLVPPEPLAELLGAVFAELV